MEKIIARVTIRKVGASTTATMDDPSWIELEAVFDSPKDDLSSWEIINPSDDDEELERYSFDEDQEEEEEDIYVLNSISPERDLDDLGIKSLDVREVKVVSIGEQSGRDAYNDYDDGDYDDDVEDDEEEEDDDDDYDDELVPRSLSDRFGKQRLMKLGKRAYNPKMSNPKKLPCYFYNRPGGVHAKTVVAWKRKSFRK